MPDLTRDQIADFNARAEAGEKPCHPGWRDCFPKWFNERASKSLFGYRVAWNESKIGEFTPYANAFEPDINVPIGPFTSLAAAQLAAEHLLGEATRPLHQGAYEALRMISMTQRTCSDVNGRYCPEQPELCVTEWCDPCVARTALGATANERGDGA